MSYLQLFQAHHSYRAGPNSGIVVKSRLFNLVIGIPETEDERQYCMSEIIELWIDVVFINFEPPNLLKRVGM